MRGWESARRQQAVGRRVDAYARVCFLGFPSPVSLALLLQLFVLYSVGAPRQSRLQGTGLCLRGFGKELENRREALPGS